MRYALDTTAFSAAMRRDPSLLELLKKYRPGDIVTVPPVMAEIHYGIERLDSSNENLMLLRFDSFKMR